MLLVVAAAMAAAFLVNHFLVPASYLAGALYLVPVLLAAQRWGPTAIGATALCAVAGVALNATLQGTPPAVIISALLALVLCAYLAISLSRQRAAAAGQAAQLGESEERFRLLVQGVEDYAIFMLDADGRVASWNAGAERIKGYRAEEILGRPYATFFTPEDAAAGRPQRLLRRALDEGHTEDLGWRVRKDGSRFWADADITALRDPSGQLRGFAKVTRDVTERHRMEEERARYAEELERRVAERTAALQEVNAELQAFSASISHDLRSPLRTMQGFAEALEEDYGPALDETAQDYLARITDAARRMDGLIGDILAYSRLSREEIQAHAVSLDAVVAEALSGVHRSVEEVGARVEVGAGLPVVLGHHPILVQVVTNLLTNALKFVPPGQAPHVRVWGEPVEREGRRWGRLWVEDRGIGIAPEHTERIFNVLERLHGRETYPGTGIGLAIVRRGVERLGGRAGVESEVGQGSRFWVELPLAPGSETALDSAVDSRTA